MAASSSQIGKIVYVDPEYREPTRAKLIRYGNETTMNLPESLYKTIRSHPYFRGLYRLKAFHPVIHEIDREIRAITVYEAGSDVEPSKAMILLYKLYTLKLTENQINNMIRYPSNPLVRALGFLYLRLSVPPAEMVNWLWDYLEDYQPLQLNPKTKITTIGKYCQKLLTHQKFESQLLLPRLPGPLVQEIAIQMSEKFPSQKISQKRQRSDISQTMESHSSMHNDGIPSKRSFR